jgi:hypothetical protein
MALSKPNADAEMDSSLLEGERCKDELLSFSMTNLYNGRATKGKLFSFLEQSSLLLKCLL